MLFTPAQFDMLLESNKIPDVANVNPADWETIPGVLTPKEQEASRQLVAMDMLAHQAVFQLRETRRLECQRQRGGHGLSLL